jgi:membrane protein insertase Oxa1/YidC/SpoIIIJ
MKLAENNPTPNPPAKDNMDEVKDSNQKTFVNENLWMKFAFKLLSYLVYTIAMSIILNDVFDGNIGWSWGKFVYGLQFMILPLVWQTLDAQARNKEIQAKLDADALLSSAQDELQNVQDQKKDLEIEVAKVKAELDTKCTELAANQQALDRAKQQVI